MSSSAFAATASASSIPSALPTPLDIAVRSSESDLELPRHAYPGDAGCDLRSAEDVVLAPFERRCVDTGFSIALPRGYAGLVIPRSGLALTHGISIVNAPGLIDADYRGSIGVILVNLDPNEPFVIAKGDRIAQLMIVSVPLVHFEEVPSLDDTDRGSKGFGSSGV